MHASLWSKEGPWQSHHLEKAQNPQGSGQGVREVGLSLWQYGLWEGDPWYNAQSFHHVLEEGGDCPLEV